MDGTGQPAAPASDVQVSPDGPEVATDLRSGRGPADIGLGGPLAVRLRLDIAYDGTDFRGWSTQPGTRTVQGALVEAIDRHRVGDLVAGLPTCAGRTDAGVHAHGQVAHLDLHHRPDSAAAGARGAGPDTAATPVDPTDLARDLARAVRRWRRALPPDVGLRAVTVAPAGFDARFSAVWRRYVYRVSDPRTPADPLLRGFVVRHAHEVSPELVTEAAARLSGEHDFAAFCRRKPDGTTIRTLLDCRAERSPAGIVEIGFRADAFCRQMVRSLVGALLLVGDGHRDVSWPAELLAGTGRAAGVTVASARGLCLEEVGYPPDAELAGRAARTRAVRTLAADAGRASTGWSAGLAEGCGVDCDDDLDQTSGRLVAEPPLADPVAESSLAQPVSS